MKQLKSSTHLNVQQGGFTIVEIMLAITLSMILIAGVIQIYLSSKESFRVQNELARLQENQRIALEFLQRDIRLAGFVAPPARITAIPGPLITVNDGGANNSDTITVEYQSLTDCLGAPTPNGFAANTYSVNPVTLQLMCQGNGGGAPQPIADGIENMQILLGDNTTIETNPDRIQYADRYVNPTTPNVRTVSVRIALLVRTQGPIRTQAIAQNITLLDTNIVLNDRLRRQVITTTIPLQNVRNV